MPRTYSKSGCHRCKLRKTKCTEERPQCTRCAKWKFQCSYSPQPSARSTQAVLPPNPDMETIIAQSVRTVRLARYCDNEMEGMVLRDIPDSIKAFYSPTSDNRIKDLQTMWQLMTSNNLLRHAGIACFSVILHSSAALRQLNQESYGKALRSLRFKVTCEGLDEENIICVVAAIVFLGKMESFSALSFADALSHWAALIPLLGKERVVNLSEQLTLPLNEGMLIFESLLYHVGTHAIFSRMTDKVWELWQTHKILDRICTLNPDGPNRLNLSPLLSGRYTLYDLSLQLTHLLQNSCIITADKAHELDALVDEQDSRLDTDFHVGPETTVKHEAERAIYHMYCNSLLICITALRESTSSQRCRMEKLVEVGLKMFLALPLYGELPHLASHAGHFMLAAIWPIQIQGCAAYDTQQFQIFMDHFLKLKPFLDPGHQERAERWMKQVSRILKGPLCEDQADPVTAEGKPLPPGLTLLRIKGVEGFR